MKGIQYKKIEPVHEDQRRTLIEIFNGDFNNQQLKLLKIKEDSVLGNHYHLYRQFFYILKGNSVWTFEDINTKEKKVIKIVEGDFIIIDKEIAHKSVQNAGNIMIEGNEHPYTSPEINDRRYEVD